MNQMTDFLSWPSLVGALWTVAVVVGLVRGKDGPLAFRWTWLVCALLLAAVLRIVLSAMAGVEAAAGGLTVLDARYPYNVSDVLAFAEALGSAGRAQYATFQLGLDTLAPPAFAGFVASVACVTLSRPWARAALLPIWLYLASVLAANAFMPIIMLNYPQLDTPALQLLLHLTPWLDFAKYSLHLVAWGVIVTGWVVALLRHRFPKLAASR